MAWSHGHFLQKWQKWAANDRANLKLDQSKAGYNSKSGFMNPVRIFGPARDPFEFFEIFIGG